MQGQGYQTLLMKISARTSNMMYLPFTKESQNTLQQRRLEEMLGLGIITNGTFVRHNLDWETSRQHDPKRGGAE